ncbi:phage terminase large subunit family protein [Exilibacterium tricleocarpae]|uniref:phage terminase large subunit family protein n=1 Tax=Exilibacterium tricleocarpae TaxID=2591008 RepID=UPI0015D2ACC7|nr:terminase gpA endonuclease subunit [Exilibacterium tricleocarpae]
MSTNTYVPPWMLLQAARANLHSIFCQALRKLQPADRVDTAEWAQAYLKLPKENSDTPGEYDLYYAPYLYGIFAALDDPDIPEVNCMKAAQVAWTTALIAYILKRVDCDPSAIIGMFAGEGAAREFSDEKLVPIVKETARVQAKIDISMSRRSGNRTLHRNFPGGFLKLISSNAIRSVKSTPAKVLFVEEPDDSNENVKEQGDSVLLLWERAKRQRKPKKILGGTPALKGFSRVERHILRSDRRVLPVACHACGEKHVLDFDHVKWDEAEMPWHEEYGRALPDTAFYVCPHCGVTWDDYQRKENIRDTVMAAIAAGDLNCGWVAQGTFAGVAGFMELSELYSCLPGAGMRELVEAKLQADHRKAQGDDNAEIVFVNSKLGRPYEYDDGRDDAQSLRERAKQDEFSQGAELVCPAQGLLVTCGIDVQHDRVELVFRAWGVGEESWLLYYGAIYADGSCADKNDAVWPALDSQIFASIRHATGCQIYVKAISIDSSDGATSDAVYHWVRSRQKQYRERLVMAIKGASLGDPEIFSTPKVKSVDHKNPKKQTKADKYGVKVFSVGTNKAKDWLAAHMKLFGAGPGRFHYYQGVRDDYFDHMTAEAKIPSKRSPGKKVWECKSGRRCEAWDCEVYALHAARAKRVHLMQLDAWLTLEAELKQNDLFTVAPTTDLVSLPAVDSDPVRGDARRPSTFWNR